MHDQSVYKKSLTQHSVRPGMSEGFTLMESLVAVMLLAISLVLILQLFSGGLKSGKLANDYTRAVFYAREKMEEILIADQLREQEVAEGEFIDGYSWKTTVCWTDIETEEEKQLPVALFDVKVEIAWNQGEREKKYSISTQTIAKKIDSQFEKDNMEK